MSTTQQPDVRLLDKDVLAMQTALAALRTCRVQMGGTRFKQHTHDDRLVRDAIKALEKALGL